MPLSPEDIARHQKNATMATPGNIDAIREQAVRSRTTFQPGDRVYADRVVKPGHGTVVCTHSCSAYVAVTIDLDEHGRARVEASRVRRSNVPAPAAPETPQKKSRRARKTAAAPTA